MDDIAKDVASLTADQRVHVILEQLCAITGMGFAAVARVTDQRWIACQVIDSVEFGLDAGSELEISTTICNDIRQTGEPVFIDSVADSPHWRLHPIPVLYGFQSYVSLPVYRADGSFFGTLCAIDNEPRKICSPDKVAAITSLASDLTQLLPASIEAASDR
jgi:GAF domain-containing protein